MTTTHTQGTTRTNAYERAKASNFPPKPWQRAFTRDQLIGGVKSHELSAHLRQYVPCRTSRFHQAIEADSGTCSKFMERIGFAGVGASYYSTQYARPGKALPDIFSCGGSYLYWSTSPMPGTLAVVSVKIQGADVVDIYVCDVVSMTVACLFNGNEDSAIQSFLQENPAS
jgi:hypothetical protein